MCVIFSNNLSFFLKTDPKKSESHCAFLVHVCVTMCITFPPNHLLVATANHHDTLLHVTIYTASIVGPQIWEDEHIICTTTGEMESYFYILCNTCMIWYKLKESI